MLAFGRVCHLFLLVFCVYVWLNPHQVMQVVREQITRALAMKPSSIDQLKTKLRGLNYSEILRLRQSERMSQDDFQSPPIMSVCVHTTFLSHYLPWEFGCNFFSPFASQVCQTVVVSDPRNTCCTWRYCKVRAKAVLSSLGCVYMFGHFRTHVNMIALKIWPWSFTLLLLMTKWRSRIGGCWR